MGNTSSWYHQTRITLLQRKGPHSSFLISKSYFINIWKIWDNKNLKYNSVIFVRLINKFNRIFKKRHFNSGQKILKLATKLMQRHPLPFKVAWNFLYYVGIRTCPSSWWERFIRRFGLQTCLVSLKYKRFRLLWSYYKFELSRIALLYRPSIS